jgi:hypothetical protein
MDHCRYCRKEISPEVKACDDCTDYVTAARVASRVLQDSDIESGALAASIGAEIVREYLCRSVGGARIRQSRPLLSDLHGLRGRPLL